MSDQSAKEKISDWMRRQEFPSGILEYRDILRLAAESALGLPTIEAEQFVQANSTKYWNWLKEESDNDLNKGLYPNFVIKDNTGRRLSWYAKDLSALNSLKEKQRATLLSARPRILNTVDAISDRDYEALSCVVSRLLQADHVVLTRKGNEGGIDFFASIVLPHRSHIFGGLNGPLRIVGQCKKYTRKVQVDKVNEFITTLNNVKHRTPPVDDLVPTWFKAGKGPILGWIIAHTGFQSGAISTAQCHGITLSDSRDLTEIISLSRMINICGNPDERASHLRAKIKEELQIFDSSST